MVSPIFSHDSYNTATLIEVTNNKIRKISSQFKSIYGYKEFDLIDLSIYDFLKMPKELIDSANNSGIHIFKAELPTKWGVYKELLIIKIALDNETELFVFKDDYNDSILSCFYQDSTIDRLTGLQNKHAFNKELNSNEKFFGVFVDIKDFASITSYYGEDFADSILVELSTRLKANFNINDIYKISADIFCVLSKESCYSSVKEFTIAIGNKIRSIYDIPLTKNKNFTILDYTMGIGFGTGCNIFENTNIALRQAKENGVKKYTYCSELHTKKQEDFIKEIKILDKIRAALKDDRICVFFQPIHCNLTESISKYECLVRLKEKDSDTFLSPSFFLDVAKKHNLNNEISKVVIRKSFDYFKDKKEISFSINLAVQALQDYDMYGFVLNSVDSFPEPNRIIFEIIENEAMPLDLFDENVLIRELKNRKCSFALDDFGSGYSNLSMLTYFNYDYLKIDGSLISSIKKESSYETIKTIVKLAHFHNVKVVAEWVTSSEIQNIIKGLEVDYSQGYFFGKPEAEII